VAGLIPKSFIDEVVSRTDLVELIDQRVPLKKAGKDFQARCPFHDEKTPSFTVSRDKQFYHCFGCGAHGTAIGFLMEYDHMEFVDAVESLAAHLGMEVPRTPGAAQAAESTRPLFDLLERANRYYRDQLRDHTRAAAAIAYLKGRGVSGEIAAEFQLGYAPAGWDGLGRALATGEGERRDLVRAGLLIAREDGHSYDRFRDRVTFAIRDRRGRTIGFGARTLGDDTPKCLNSPETSIFHKGRELYGLYEAQRANRTLERILVVEGYMDVVSLARHGVRNAVAVLGTAVTGDHVERLFRSAPDVVFCLDGDAAGRRAAWHALETVLPALKDGRQAFFMFLPEGEDRDTLIRQIGREAFERLVAAATPLTEHLFAHLLESGDRDTVEGRARIVDRARPLIARLPEGALRHLATRRLSELAGLDSGELSTLIGESISSPVVRGSRTSAGPPSLVRHCVTLLLHYPRLARLVADVESVRVAGLPGVELLAEMIELARADPELSSGALVEHFRDHPAGRHLPRLLAGSTPPAGEALEREFMDYVEHIVMAPDDRRFRELQRHAREGRLSPEEEREMVRLVAASRGAKRNQT